MTFSSRSPPPELVATDRSRDASMIPPTPAMNPLIMNTAIRTRSTLMPARRAASGVAADRVDVAAEPRSRRDEGPEHEEEPEDHRHGRDAAVLVRVPDRGEGHDGEPDDLQGEQRSRLRVQAAGATGTGGLELENA